MKLFDVYPLLNVEPVKAQGIKLWDKQGNEYLDLYGGHAVISIGHTHPHYVKKITEQLNNIAFYSNSVVISVQRELAEKLGKLSGYDNYDLFLVNSGAEANENALKLASFHTGRKKIISFSKSFHGRTSLAVAATDGSSMQAPVNKTENIQFLPFNDIEAFEKNMNEDVAAVIIEGIQGVGGVQIPSTPFLKKIDELCKKFKAVLILDEVQSGYGRSGKFFAHQYSGVKADLITVAKGMGNGFPIAGVLISPEFKAVHGMLGTTFGGNHLACAAGIAVLDVIKDENLLSNSENIGNYLMTELKKVSGVKEIRGLGLMIGVELEIPCAGVRNSLLDDHKIFTGSSSDKNTMRILPALNITKEEADLFLKAFKSVMSKMLVK
ncbi:MAG: aminotransferase class III-fold pyridoxal phosphate-dependent enzyme [Sporocytophaga sp.]|uniref:aspartate aminotransferase family protein n=1 Tax=Sporocytophaga sp. TaxID=2231183 RepID=UPI001B19581D|nr:aminotransferase class III-fold pyridoxal phosphate-dependent enzyme [Sporocytophaga sp.]MBO9699799.1 aminotransferase class III-fold pyridoxal phosphate-dependent enzyme [Sporocytophaga sp.]